MEPDEGAKPTGNPDRELGEISRKVAGTLAAGLPRTRVH
jgi:hypothetical protein